jgi:Ca2+-binding RTX toxin-like protein
MSTIVEQDNVNYDYLITGTSVDDYLTGDPYGSSSRDIIKGLEGNDTLKGGDLRDSLEGGPGADLLDGGSGSDYASYKDSPEGVEIHLRPGEASPSGGDAEGDTLISIENVSGSDFRDILLGDDDANTLIGNAGDDFINSGPGDDNIYAGSGDDALTGEVGNDGLTGGAGNDYMDGADGGDWLTGSAGNDFMVGGSGSDSFYFWTADSGNVFAGQADTIADFNDEDTIFLNGSYAYAGDTSAPVDGQYSIWQNGSDWVVTWNAVNDSGYHDVTVQGANPVDDVSFFV